MEMDFLVQREGALLPIEVKGGTSIKATSLHNYLKEHPDISAIRYSMLPYRQQENISNMPLYGVFLRTKCCVKPLHAYRLGEAGKVALW